MALPQPKQATRERQSQVSSLLKEADKDVKNRDLDAALAKVRTVYSLDPGNMYARAYEERILTLKNSPPGQPAASGPAAPTPSASPTDNERVNTVLAQQQQDALKRREQEQREELLERQAREASVHERKELVDKDIAQLEAETLKRVEAAEQRLASELQRSLEEERRRLTEQTQSVLDEMKTSIQEAARTPSPPPVSRSEVIDQLKQEYADELLRARQQFKLEMIAQSAVERRSIQAELLEKLKDERNRVENELKRRTEEDLEAVVRREHLKAREHALAAYRSTMELMAHVKLPVDAQSSLLRSLRISLAISDSDHAEVERTVGAQAYVEAVRDTWRRGQPSAENLDVLKSIGNLYNISSDHQQRIMGEVRKELGLPSDHAHILVLDDEEYILQFVETILKQTYESVALARNVDEAIREMQRTPPSVILTDVNLDTPEVSGFTFCERMKNGTYGQEFTNTPFVIMSAVADDFFMKSARQLGAKGYLPKPFTRERLELAVREAIDGGKNGSAEPAQTFSRRTHKVRELQEE